MTGVPSAGGTRIRVRELPPGWRAQAGDLPAPLQQIFARRGLSPLTATDYSLQKLCDYRTLLGLDKAVDLLLRALRGKWHIVIVADFDADGATGCALAVDVLGRVGAERVSYVTPNRFRHSYGLSPELFIEVQRLAAQLIITVDNGISSVAGVAAARAAGVPVLITDHHLPGEQLPAADAIVNPNQPGCTFPSKHIAGVGVMFYLLIALRARLRELDWFQARGLAEPVLADWLDLVALGTVADVVTLDENNRCLVQQGLLRIRSGLCRPGIQALARVSKVACAVMTTSDISFHLAPRLNAAGRLDDMDLGIRCLLERNFAAAEGMARQLDNLNRKRRAMETEMGAAAQVAIGRVALEEAVLPAGICMRDPDWHVGLIGILATRIRDRWQRPAIAMAPDPTEPSRLRGSARSIEGLHIRDLLANIDSRDREVLIHFGGHAMAAGLTIHACDFKRFCLEFAAEAAAMCTPEMLSPEIVTDGELAAADLRLELAELCRLISPWGKGFPRPIFHGDFRVGSGFVMQKRHIRWRLQPWLAGGQDEEAPWVDALAFNTRVEDWHPGIRDLRIVYELDVNAYRGVKRLQLLVREWWLRTDASHDNARG